MWLLLLSSLSLVTAACDLCNGVDKLVNPLDFVNSKGKMCGQLMVELFSLNESDVICTQWIESSRTRCCTLEGVPPIHQDPPPPPPQFSVDGPYRQCQLCQGGGVPTATGMVINMLYIGVGSCIQYYEWGQRGWILNHLCSALQHFAGEPCGCPLI